MCVDLQNTLPEMDSEELTEDSGVWRYIRNIISLLWGQVSNHENTHAHNTL